MGFFEDVYTITKRIPRGRVATYGQVAALLGKPKSARMVGWALHALDGKTAHAVPWQRVINKQGSISTTCLDHPPEEQAHLLRREGVVVDEKKGSFYIDLEQYLWKPKE